MGFFSSLGSAISSGFSSACSAVGSAISSTFGAVSNTFNQAVSTLNTVLPTVSVILNALAVPFPQLRAAAQICDAALTVLGLLNINETSEEIGDRVLQGYDADIKPSNFSNYDEYMAEIRAMPLDPEKSKTFNAGEKIVAGLSTLAWGMEQKLGQGSSDLISVIVRDSKNIENGTAYFSEAKVEAIFSVIKNVSEVVDYFKGKLSPESASSLENELVKVERQLDPSKPIDDIYKDLDKLIEK